MISLQGICLFFAVALKNTVIIVKAKLAHFADSKGDLLQKLNDKK